MADVRSSRKNEISTIDCTLITVETQGGDHFGFDTANQIQAESQYETTDAVTNIIKGILRAQKPEIRTPTRVEITLSDNVFNPELVAILQGGTIIHDTEDPSVVIGYRPPAVGSRDKGEVFTLNTYTTIYDEAGLITGYRRISYPNCTGSPVAFSNEDDAFATPEYTIFSSPSQGEYQYILDIVKELPVIVGQNPLPTLTVTSVAGAMSGETAITVMPTLLAGNSYMYKSQATPITLPLDLQIPVGYTAWDGMTDIAANTGDYIAVVEVNADGRAIAGGHTTVVSAV